MAWIKIIPENEADGELKDLYARQMEPWGGVDNIMKIHSLNPPPWLDMPCCIKP